MVCLKHRGDRENDHADGHENDHNLPDSIYCFLGLSFVHMFFKKKISLYIPVVVVLMVVAGLVMYAFVRTAKRKYAAERELLANNTNIEKLTRENEEIKSDIDNFNKESFVEKEVRRNLNMKKEDEEVLFIVNGSAKNSSSDTSSDYQKKENDSIPLYRKNMSDWFNFVFLSK